MQQSTQLVLIDAVASKSVVQWHSVIPCKAVSLQCPCDLLNMRLSEAHLKQVVARNYNTGD